MNNDPSSIEKYIDDLQYHLGSSWKHSVNEVRKKHFLSSKSDLSKAYLSIHYSEQQHDVFKKAFETIYQDRILLNQLVELEKEKNINLK